METKSVNEISTYSIDLIEYLNAKQVGELVTYEELSELIGHDVTQSKGRGYLETAKRRLLKDHAIVFGTIRTEGIKRLSDEEIARTVGKRYIKAVRSKSRKAYDENTSVNFDSLTPDAKISHQCTMTILALMKHVTDRKSVKKIENKVKETYTQIDQKETLRMLRQPLMNGSE